MNLKSVRDFIILRPAFTGRNISSIGLVAIFFFVYVAAGGKITTIPKIQGGADFGTAANVNVSQEKKPAVTTLQEKAAKIEEKKPSAASRVSQLFGSKKDVKDSQANNVRKTSSSGEANKKGGKSLDDIEARLKQLRSK